MLATLIQTAATVGDGRSIAVESRINRSTEPESMPRETRTRPASGIAPVPLASLLAHSTTPNELLPHLHQFALDLTGGSRSLLFQRNPRTGGLQATSGFGLETLKSDPWLPGPDEAALVADAFARRMPTFVSDTARQTPDLAARLETRAALLLPLVRRGDRIGLLAIGFDEPPRDRLRHARGRSRRRLRHGTRAVPPPPGRGAAARRPRPARGVHRQPFFDAEPRGRTRDLLPRRQPAVRRGPHVGLDPRSARASSRTAGLVGPGRPRARRPGRRRRPLGAGGIAMRRLARRNRAVIRRRSHGHRDGAPAWLPPGARHHRLRRRARRDRRGNRSARSRRRARPSTVERDREHAAARGRDAFAAGAREHVRLNLPPGGGLGHARRHRARQPGVRDARAAQARGAAQRAAGGASRPGAWRLARAPQSVDHADQWRRRRRRSKCSIRYSTARSW